MNNDWKKCSEAMLICGKWLCGNNSSICPYSEKYSDCPFLAILEDEEENNE